MNIFLKKLFHSKPKAEKDSPGKILKSYMAHFLPDAPVILEGGAHVGSDTAQLAEMFPKGHVYAFEPLPHLFKRLQMTTRRNRNVTCHPIALSDRNGTVTMYVSEGASDASSSLRQPKEHLTYHPDVSFNQKIEVPCLRLDDWALQNHISHIDFIWLDVQGHELSVLKAGENILATVRAIYTEVNLIELYEGAPTYAELRGWLEARGFVVEKEALAWEDAGNVLFVRRELFDKDKAP
jgi:FkbM family methyltransferase